MAIAMLSGMAKASQKKAIKVSGNGMYLITPDRGRLLRSVTVEVEAPIADYDTGFEAGKQAEYDAFWDNYQENGERDNYQYAFAGRGWNSDIFKPKYDICPTTLNTGFYYFAHKEKIENAVDFVEIFDNRGLIFDTSNCTNFMSGFMWARIKRLGVIDVRKDTQKLSNTFSYGQIQTIERLIVNENTQYSNNTFQNQATLQNITFEGVIGTNNLNLQWSKKLSKASIENVISCLSATTSGLTVTFSKTAVNTAFETGEGYADGSDSAAWSALIATKSNWTISLV